MSTLLQLGAAARLLSEKTPMGRYLELTDLMPIWEDIDAMYDPLKERIRVPNYHIDLAVNQLKRSL